MLFFVWWKLKKYCIFTKTKTTKYKNYEIQRTNRKTTKQNGERI